MTDRDERIQNRGRELVELVIQRLPQEVEITGDDDFWPAVSLGLLSRMAGTLQSILDLQLRWHAADATTLGRSLYEHAVHFAWLAADPSAARLQEWRKYDLQQRLKADTDMARFGQHVYSDEQRAYVVGQVASLVGKSLILEQLAIAADDAWLPRIPGLVAGATQSFAGLYASLYRHSSGTAHPTVLGLNRVTDDLSPTRRRIRIERTDSGTGPYGMATVVFGAALHVAAQTIGWPSADEIDAIFGRNPS